MNNKTIQNLRDQISEIHKRGEQVGSVKIDLKNHTASTLRSWADKIDSGEYSVDVGQIIIEDSTQPFKQILSVSVEDQGKI
ncbi:hypothetical protein F0H41_18245 [Vibrio cholerae]|uniref:hypothetical protein n=1 Tax=Vibrio cholerae TaxID=666 RepID=UPI0011F3A635|nr:hypothetical protein [Vibrio cholerae]EGQ7971065.1 hypothetical protein [Vibrio cholerae]EJL6691962.1 hypothetical protein [Vibrio cholerae]ELJ8535007.1 hypothetical protein [Vibrio cholerae]KAA0998762.1 hypothetical protein F0H41_18245 [Vibrio cholerae]KAA1004966.1 hypothetical protein F0H40_18245 [Vibrio cholerae]